MRNILFALILSFSVSAFSQITITQGESPTLTLTLTVDSAGTPFDLTGATFVTKFLGLDRIVEVSVLNAAHTITNALSGNVTVALVSADTLLTVVSVSKTFVTIVTTAGKDRYFWADGQLTVRAPLIKDN